MDKKLFAFTLIELLVVIAIIGILSGLIVVAMGGITNSANVAKAQIFSNSLRNSLMMNLVSEWKFDELTTATNGATILDSWSGGNNGTLSTGDALDKLKTGSDCVSGKCLSFDGSNDYVSCGNRANLNITDAITITAWANPIEDKLEAIVMDLAGAGGSGGVPIEFYRQVGGQLRFVSYYNSIPGTITHAAGGNIPLNTWSFVTATFDKNLASSAAKVYINGVQVASGNDQTPLPILEQMRTIGSYGGGGWFFNGKMDDVRIFNAAVPTSQIKEQYYSGLNSLFAKGQITKGEYLSRVQELAQR